MTDPHALSVLLTCTRAHGRALERRCRRLERSLVRYGDRDLVEDGFAEEEVAACRVRLREMRAAVAWVERELAGRV